MVASGKSGKRHTINQMDLIIDIGNSSAKLAVFCSEKIVFHSSCRNDDLSILPSILASYDIRRSIVSTVAGLKGKVGPQLREAGLPDVLLNDATAPEYNKAYGLPSTMGSDRLGAIVAAKAKFPGRNVLVVDNGSCITYEFIAADGRYLGGNISPGIFMRLQAMHTWTSLLPLVDTDGPLPDIGYDTYTAMRSGAVNGVNHEVEGYIRHAQTLYPDLVTIITGGADTEISIKGADVVSDKDLVFEGLREILAKWVPEKK